MTNKRRRLAFLRIGIPTLASASIGIFDSKTMLPVALVFMATSWIAFAILLFGKRFIPEVKYVGRKRRGDFAELRKGGLF